MIWNFCEKDKISTNQISLNLNDFSKRQILQSLASQYDLYNLNGPLLNRLFVHKLQCEKNLGWDEKLCSETLIEWHNIVRQANSSPPIEVSRFVDKRSDKYKSFAFVAASKKIYEVVIYIFNFNISKNKFSFVTAKKCSSVSKEHSHNYLSGHDPSILDETKSVDNSKFQVPNSCLGT